MPPGVVFVLHQEAFLLSVYAGLVDSMLFYVCGIQCCGEFWFYRSAKKRRCYFLRTRLLQQNVAKFSFYDGAEQRSIYLVFF